MKPASFSLFLLLGLSAVSCSFLDIGFYRKSRAECERSDKIIKDHSSSEADSNEYTPIMIDTLLYYSAVQFQDDYDWRRDTAFGATTYNILLYRNGEPIISISSASAECISPDPDMQHIIGGHLFTEASTASQTIIGYDGKELFRFEGREYLKGLVVSGEDVYTLSIKRSGNGFSFRKNGYTLFVMNSGTIFGGFSEPSYGPNGALYMDNGKCCFSFYNNEDGERINHVICDGFEETIPSIRTVKASDIRRVFSLTRAITDNEFGQVIEDGRIWPKKLSIVISGRIKDNITGNYYSGVLSSNKSQGVIKLCDEEAVIYHGKDVDYALREDENGYICIQAYNGQTIKSTEPATLLSPSCAAIKGKELIVAISPKGKARAPIVMIGQKQMEVKINGYITCVSVELIQST